MIDFRYHLVSIIAVFFALAAGIVLGAGPLGEQVADDLPDQLSSMSDQNSELRDQILAFQTSQEYQQSFVDVVADELVSERLDGESILVVGLPGADGDRIEQLRGMLERSGATVTGTVRVDSSWSDPDSESALDALAVELTTRPLPANGDGYDRGATVLANAVLSAQRRQDIAIDPATGLEETPGDPSEWMIEEAVITGFSEAGFIEVDGELTGKANLTVVVADANALAEPPSEDDEGEASESEGEQPEWFDRLVTLVEEFEEAGRGTVVAGERDTVAEHDVLGIVRGSDDLADDISTVDSVELATGQVAVVYAVAEQAAGDAGHYGLTESAGALSPPIPDRPIIVSPVEEENPDEGDPDGEPEGDPGSEPGGEGSESGEDNESGDDPVGAGVVGASLAAAGLG